MACIRLETFIDAPVELCFDAARNIDLHASATSPLKHRPVEGVTSGLINLGEEVTWEGSFFGIGQRMTSRIVNYSRPDTFTDEMKRGPFKRWRHKHSFTSHGKGSLILDEVSFASPLGPVGYLFDVIFLKRFMTRILTGQNEAIRTSLMTK